MLKYPQRPSKDIVFKENFDSSDYTLDNGGIITGSPTIDKGVTLNGTDQCIEFPGTVGVDFEDGTVSMLCTIKTTDTQGTILTNTKNTANWTGLALSIGTDSVSNKLNLWASNDTALGGSSTDTGADINDGNEHRVVVTYDQNNVIFYHDGVLSSQVVKEHVIGASPNGFRVGVANLAPLGRWFSGMVKDVEVRKYIMTAEEVADDYTKQTFTDIDVSKSLFHLPLRSSYNDGTKYRTKNIGTLPDPLWGNGVAEFNKPVLVQKNGADFNDVTASAINFGDITELNATSSFTLFLLIKERDLDSMNVVFMKYGDGNNNITFRINNNGLADIYMEDGETAYKSFNYSTVVAGGRKQEGTYQSVCLVYDGSLSAADRCRLYVNTQRCSTSGIVGTIPATTSDLTGIPATLGLVQHLQ